MSEDILQSPAESERVRAEALDLNARNDEVHATIQVAVDLAIAAEREACARVLDEMERKALASAELNRDRRNPRGNQNDVLAAYLCRQAAEKIRKRA